MNTWGTHVVHRLYRPKNGNMNLPDYYQFVMSTMDMTNVGCDVIVAECVDKWLYQVLVIDTLLISRKGAAYFKMKNVVGQSTRASTAPAGCEYGFLKTQVNQVEVFV